MRRISSVAALLAAHALVAGEPAQAAPAGVEARWHAVASRDGERVEIDKSRIARLESGHSAAWTRLTLARELREADGTVYTAVLALNRYDCAARRFATLKRLYRRGATTVREEDVAEPRPMPAAAGSIDERLLAEACKARTVGELQQVANDLQRAAQGVDNRPGVMHADMRSAQEATKGRVTRTADAKPGDKPADKSAEKPAERPRFIELPKIDKSQVEDPRAKPADARAVAQAAEKAAAERPALNRQEIERQYATSGPRRAAPKKTPATPAAPAVVDYRNIHWSYEGEGGPANWARLRPDYATCATGKRQSPIDIRDGVRVDLEPIRFDYKTTMFRIVDNGHTVQVDVGEGSTIAVMGRRYELKQFHFHRPAEERVNGKAYDMVAHLVHKDEEGRLAVVAVLLEKGVEHALIQTLWNNLPLEVNMDITPATAIDPNRLLPEDRAYHTYMGSLTTPPCTEGVLWMVLKQPVQLSAEQIAIFSRLYRNNARPVQPANNRLIKESR